MIAIRKALPEDVEIVSRLFRKAIKTLDAQDYDPSQLNAWSAIYQDKSWWIERIRMDYFIVAEEKNRILGFCSVNQEGSLDLLYVHKDYQGNGVGRALMSEVDRYFSGLNIREIFSEVSINAKPFFEKMGFNLTLRQITNLGGIEVPKYLMKKKVTRLNT